jgi:hypothetical protein
VADTKEHVVEDIAALRRRIITEVVDADIAAVTRWRKRRRRSHRLLAFLGRNHSSRRHARRRRTLLSRLVRALR